MLRFRWLKSLTVDRDYIEVHVKKMSCVIHLSVYPMGRNVSKGLHNNKKKKFNCKRVWATFVAIAPYY